MEGIPRYHGECLQSHLLSQLWTFWSFSLDADGDGDQDVVAAASINTKVIWYENLDGQGNFGSVDGDSPAAMRYTEARMRKISEDMLADIDKETVDHKLNFDDTLKEPTVLPTRVPGLLINGASGIAVGMATNMPPHNLSEVVDGTIAYIDNSDIEIDELMQHIKAQLLQLIEEHQ